MSPPTNYTSRSVRSTGAAAARKRARSRTATRAAYSAKTTRVNRNAGRTKSKRQSSFRKVLQSVLQVSWRRVGLATVSAVLACVLGTSVGYGGHLLYEKLISSESFAVEKIRIMGSTRADGDMLRSLAGVQNSENIFTINLDEVKRGVSSHPWISSAEVSRILPRTIRIDVKEHRPVLLVALGALYYVDSSGTIVKRYTPGETEDLPVLTGLTRHDFENDALQTRVRLRELLSFLKVYKRESNGKAQEIEELHLDPVMGLTIVPVGDSRRVRMGHAPWGQKIRQWKRMENDSGLRDLPVKEVILGGTRRPERVVMRLMGLTASKSGGTL
jgi:cell division septal protein FtsQ